ncbi:GNAT family N-acetyltransferase [Paenibacillus wenxiniae]|uniref:GNAT family N-acetyltransferase n=1 Tax=Paenibacillus wenxiniae TaxID=1636843 RepID=A0ABW4RIJ4_9BACL
MEIQHRIPLIDEYLHLRKISGLSEMSREGAEKGLPLTLFAVILEEQGEVIGMGRVVGDGGLFFQVTDIAVHPDHQGKGYGKAIMGEIKQYLHANMPPRAMATLFADVPADHLYAQFGFEYSSPVSLGMWLRQSP